MNFVKRVFGNCPDFAFSASNENDEEEMSIESSNASPDSQKMEAILPKKSSRAEPELQQEASSSSSKKKAAAKKKRRFSSFSVKIDDSHAVYHERQKLMFCAMHAINNLVNKKKKKKKNQIEIKSKSNRDQFK